jgi:hypothetical protein
MMEKTKAVEQVFPQERNFAAADWILKKSAT